MKRLLRVHTMQNLSPHELLQKALDLDRDGNPSQAMWLCREGIRLKGKWPEAHVILGLILYNRQLYADAAAEYRKALAQMPNLFQAHNNLGNALTRLGQLQEAKAAFHRAITIKPDYAVAYTNLGNALRDLGRLDESVQMHLKALEIEPTLAAAYNNMGSVLLDLGRPDEAVTAYQKAIALAPSLPDALGNLAGAFLDSGDMAKAVSGYVNTLRMNPNDVDSHAHLAMTYLLQGNFERGWPEYEWRLRRQGKLAEAEIERAFPRWDGSPLNGRSILLHSEQGLGDTIHFVRYATLVTQLGGDVILRCQPPLVDLMKSVSGVKQVVPANQSSVPRCDLQCPLLSVPVVLKTNLTNMPATVPYITPDPQRVSSWRARLAADGRYRVGLVWAGSPTHKKDRLRSMTLQQLQPMCQVGEASFYSLQKGKSVSQIAEASLPITNLDSEIRDFSDTAAAIQSLDLVIAVDTSVAHLAGALGKPVWVMLPFSPDWRWMLHREDSPWYPTMRLFRQSKPNQWGDVLERIVNELRAVTATQRSRSAA